MWLDDNLLCFHLYVTGHIQPSEEPRLETVHSGKLQLFLNHSAVGGFRYQCGVYAEACVAAMHPKRSWDMSVEHLVHFKLLIRHVKGVECLEVHQDKIKHSR